METSDNQEYFKKNHVSGSDIEKKLKRNNWKICQKKAHSGPAVEYSHPDYQGKIGLIMPYSKDFCNTCNRLRISSIGKLYLCLFGDEGHDLRQYLKIDNEVLINEKLDALLGIKKSSHLLHSHNTGSTRHLAMLGG
jgi:cyclic pyranopterin phosphate synthase